MKPAKRAYILIGIAIGLALARGRLKAIDSTQSESRLVDVNIVALDDHGQPVNDLTRDDFQVTDGGKVQNLAYFHHRDSTQWQTAPLGPNQFSNRGRTGVPHATVILFDMLNESFGTRGYATDQITKTLEKLEDPEYVYLYILTVDGHLFVVHGLPNSDQEAAAQEHGPPWTKQIKSLMDQAQRSVSRIRPIDVDVAVRVQLTFAGLERLAIELSRVPGRKNLVWVTDGVPVALGPVRSDTGEFVDFTPQLRILSEGLDRCGVAVYPARQVIFGGPDDIGETSGTGQTGGAGTGIESQSTLDLLASMTGGRRGTGKDVASVVKQAMTDIHISYQLGYYAPDRNWDNKFHKLMVTTKRKGVHIQARTGYYAWAEPPGARAQQVFDTGASTMFDAAEIGLHADVSYDPKNARAAHFNVRVNGPDVVLVPDGNEYTAQLRLMMVGYLDDGQIEKSAVVPLDLRMNADQREDALKNGVSFSRDVMLGNNVAKVRLIIFDRGSNAFGSITIQVGTPSATMPVGKSK